MPALTTPITITTAQGGTTDYGPWSIAADQKGVKLRFFRDAWPNVGRVLTARLALRGTNQRGIVETWSSTWTLHGGDAIGPSGVQTHTWIGWEWPGEVALHGNQQPRFEDGRWVRHAIPIDQLELQIRIFEPINTVVDVESF